MPFRLGAALNRQPADHIQIARVYPACVVLAAPGRHAPRHRAASTPDQCTRLRVKCAKGIESVLHLRANVRVKPQEEMLSESTIGAGAASCDTSRTLGPGLTIAAT